VNCASGTWSELDWKLCLQHGKELDYELHLRRGMKRIANCTCSVERNRMLNCACDTGNNLIVTLRDGAELCIAPACGAGPEQEIAFGSMGLDRTNMTNCTWSMGWKWGQVLARLIGELHIGYIYTFLTQSEQASHCASLTFGEYSLPQVSPP
jgi:hypothetical protein